MEKAVRMEEIFRDEPDVPPEFWEVHNRVRDELEAIKAETGKSVLKPSQFLKPQSPPSGFFFLSGSYQHPVTVDIPKMFLESLIRG